MIYSLEALVTEAQALSHPKTPSDPTLPETTSAPPGPSSFSL